MPARLSNWRFPPLFGAYDVVRTSSLGCESEWAGWRVLWRGVLTAGINLAGFMTGLSAGVFFRALVSALRQYWHGQTSGGMTEWLGHWLYFLAICETPGFPVLRAGTYSNFVVLMGLRRGYSSRVSAS